MYLLRSPLRRKKRYTTCLCQFLIGTLLLWLFIFIYSTFVYHTEQTEDRGPGLNDVMERLRNLQQQNEELLGRKKELELFAEWEKSVFYGCSYDRDELLRKENMTSKCPSLAHELARRKVDFVSREIWLFLSSELSKLKMSVDNTDAQNAVQELLEKSRGYHRTLRHDLNNLTSIDSLTKWQLEQSLKLGGLVQRRLKYLQNPKDCENAKKLVCSFRTTPCGSGFGCLLHHVTYCMIMAYGTGRTLTLDTNGWNYMVDWESFFQPLSNTCRESNTRNTTYWSSNGNQDAVQELSIPSIDKLNPRPDFLPLAIPVDLADRIMSFHGNPAVWWIGQFVKFVTRPQKRLMKDLLEREHSQGFKRPIVGIHIRRTDKIKTGEASLHSVGEYMQHVENWYDVYEIRHPGVQRRVYLATDDPKVIREASTRYTNYIFISDEAISNSARDPNTRTNDAAVRGIITDLHFLSLCDFLVVTMSSNAGRIVYSLMQTMHGDASQYVRSLDDIYYFNGQFPHEVEAIETHVPKLDDNQANVELELHPGDIIHILGNHWDGYSKGVNTRTGTTGIFPSYKIKERVMRAKMPIYSEVEDIR